MRPASRHSPLRRPAPRTLFGARRPQARPPRPAARFGLEEARQVRVGLLLILFLVLFAVLAGRAFHLTVLKHADLTREAEANYRTTFGLSKPRGEMIDRTGERLAITVEAESVYADPQLAAANPQLDQSVAVLAAVLHLEPADVREAIGSPARFARLKRGVTEEELAALSELDPAMRRGIDWNGDVVFVNAKIAAANPRVDEVIAALAKVFEIEPDYVRDKILRPGRFEWIKRRISAEETAALNKVPRPLLAGVGRKREPARRYPNGALAASILGFTTTDQGGGLTAKEGLEGQYDALLSGAPGSVVAVKDAKRRAFSPDGVQVVNREEGRTLRLTLDAKIQLFAENALDNVVALYKPKATWAIVMEVKTGAILAMANRPTFDPNEPGDYRPEWRRNHTVLDMYEPGSTLKPITVACALASGKVKLNEQINCAVGSLVFNGKPIKEAHGGYGMMTPAQIVQKSSNVGAAKLALRLTPQELYDAFQRFGLGLRTRIDYPWEMPGQLRKWTKWKPVDQATQGFGQGISVTSMQLLAAMCALGNGGRLMQPHLVSEVLDDRGQVVRRVNPQIAARAVPEEIANEVLWMMTLVTEEGGTGKKAAVEGFKVAGKTGTAQKVVGGRYSENKYIGSFVGLLPGDDPQVGVIVVVDEPVGAIYGGVVAAPAFHEIAQRTLDYLEVFAAKRQADRRGTAAAEKSKPESGETETRVGRRVTGENVAPNFLGLTIRAAGQLADEAGVALDVEGSGVAVRQTPEPGKALDEGRRVAVEFAPQS